MEDVESLSVEDVKSLPVEDVKSWSVEDVESVSELFAVSFFPHWRDIGQGSIQ